MKHPALRWFVCLLFLGALAPGAEAPRATPTKQGAPATPPPKKKRGELEAEEEPAPLPPGRQTGPRDESYNVTMALVGTWESAGRTLTIQQTGAYTLAGAESDAGFVRASLGLVWRKSNRTQKWVEGRYQLRGMSEVEIDDLFATREWRRVK